MMGSSSSCLGGVSFDLALVYFCFVCLGIGVVWRGFLSASSVEHLCVIPVQCALISCNSELAWLDT